MSNEESQASLGDTIATNRKVEVQEPSTLPGLPDGYRESDPKVLQKTLRRIPENSRAEAVDALEECAEKGDQLSVDLGKDVPSAKQAEAIVKRLKSLRNGKARLLALLSCYEELEDIANHDAVLYLEAVRTEHEYFSKKKPQLVQEYQHMDRFFKDRSEAIRRGLADAKSIEAKLAKDKEESSPKSSADENI